MAEAVPGVIVFTDLDGTLLDRDTYSYAASLPAVKVLQDRGVPIIFCSAKTRVEQEVYRGELGIADPFIVENGGAIFIPRGYFPFELGHTRSVDGYLVIELGMPCGQIRGVLERLRSQKGVAFKGFGDMTAEEVASITGLDLEMARKARQREYTETLMLHGPPWEVERSLGLIRGEGLSYTHGGRFYEVMGGNDKGMAASILIGLCGKKMGATHSIGIGDSLNDVPMLSVVDTPFLVQKPGGVWENVELPNLRLVEGVGPLGWKRAVDDIMGRLELSEK